MKLQFTQIFLSLFLAASLISCQTKPIIVTQTTPTQPPTETSQPSPTLTSTPASTSTNTPFPTLTPTVLPLIRNTPPTLMLHRSNAKFYAVQFLREMIAILKQNNMHVVTYRDLSTYPEITATEHGKLFIITIDDIYLRYPMDPSIKEMITILQEAGYPAVLGIVTEGDFAYEETASTLQELTTFGWEIATHTDNHRNLGEMEKVSPRAIYLELKDSMDKIEKASGVRPVTLILPEGQMVNDGKQLRRAELVWVVGINGGTQYDTSRDLLYVGRESPYLTAQETFDNMRKRFGF